MDVAGAPPRTSNDGLLPLDPGIYHLLPRAWLSSWRTYIRYDTTTILP
jgi:hypothetical protein